MNILQFLIDIRSRQDGVVGQVSRLQGRMDAAAQSAERLSRTVGGGLRGAFLSLPGAEFLTNPVVALTAGVGAVSKLGMDVERASVSFSNLIGSAERAAGIMRGMEGLVPLYGLGNITEIAGTMAGYGVAQDKVVQGMKSLANIAQGDTERLRGLALAFSQVASNGRLNAEDMNQMIDRGYNPLMDISRMTGKSILQLRDDMSKGLVSFDLMSDAMAKATGEGGRFGGILEKIMDSPFGKYRQMVSSLQNTLLELYSVISPLLIPAFDALSAVLSAIRPVIGGMAAATSWLVRQYRECNPWVVGLTAAVAAYSAVAAVNAFVLKGWTVAQWAHVTALIAAEKAQKLLNLAMTLNPVGLVVAGIAALAAVVAVCWNKFAGFRAFLLTAWDTVKGFGQVVWDALVSRFWALVEGIGAVGKALVALVKGDFKGAWQEARTGAERLASVYNPSDLVEGGRNVVGQVSGNWGRHLEEERRKQAERDGGIADPKAAAGVSAAGTSPISGNSGGGTATDTGKAEEITTGGTRNTQVTVNIAKFFDYMNVTMADRTDTGELRRIVLECMNRSLETAMSAAR